MSNKLAMLMILDGYGISETEEGNAVKSAHTPNINEIMKLNPKTVYNRMYQSGMTPEEALMYKRKWGMQYA